MRPLLYTLLLLWGWGVLANDDIFCREPRSLASAEELTREARWLKPPAEAYSFPSSAIQEINGNLRLLIDTEPAGGYWRSVGATTLPGAPVERLLRESADVRWFIIDTDIHGALDEEATRAFEQFSSRAERILAAVPDARFIVRVWMINTAPEFAEMYPDSVLTGPDGTSDWGWRYASGGRQRPNALASWRNYCGEHLYRLVHRIGKSPFAARTAGFYLGALNSGEWWYYKGGNDPGWDYSSTRLAAFHRLLKLKYGERVPWAPETAIEELALPTLEERKQRPLQPETAALDYLQTLNLPVTYAATYFAKIIKTATSGRCLVGIETGAGFECFPNNGTVYLRQLLKCPDIDFLGGPSSYHRRGAGRAPLHRVADASLRAHGKLWFNEGDYRTHHAYGTRSGRAGEPPADPAGARQVLRREFARGITQNYPTYLMDFSWDWWHDRGLAEEIGQLQRVGALLQEENLSAPAEIALVTDQESQLYTNYFANPLRLRHSVMENLGTSVDFFELKDFLTADISSYKLVVMLNVRALTAAEREALIKLRDNGRTFFWLHDPGAIDLDRGEETKSARMSSLTGIDLQTGIAPEGQVRVVAEAWQAHFGQPAPESLLVLGQLDYPLRRTRLAKEVSRSDAAEGLIIGNALAYTAAVDPEALTLAVDDAGHCRLAMRETETWRSYYAASCLVKLELLQAIARKAGVHIWSDQADIVYVNRKFLAVHATSDGERYLNLPPGSRICNLLNGEPVTLPLMMNIGETHLFYLGDSAAWQARLLESKQQAIEAQTIFNETHPAPLVPEQVTAQRRLLSPEAFYQQHQRVLKPPSSWDGPYPITGLVPQAWLVAGPFAEDASHNDQITEIQPRAGEADIWPVERRANRFLLPLKLPETVIGTLQETVWRPLCLPMPWISADLLGLQAGQTLMAATYLETEETQPLEIMFAAEGEGSIWLNGEPLDGEPGNFGTRIKLTAGKRHLIIVQLRYGGTSSGFTCKILAPGQAGQTARLAASGISVWLAPETR